MEIAAKMAEVNADLVDLNENNELMSRYNEELFFKIQQDQEKFENELSEVRGQKETEQKKHIKELQDISAQVDTSENPSKP